MGEGGGGEGMLSDAKGTKADEISAWFKSASLWIDVNKQENPLSWKSAVWLYGELRSISCHNWYKRYSSTWKPIS